MSSSRNILLPHFRQPSGRSVDCCGAAPFGMPPRSSWLRHRPATAAEPNAQRREAPARARRRFNDRVASVAARRNPVRSAISASRATIQGPPRASMSSLPKTPASPAPRWPIEENNAGGRFTGEIYSLDVSTASLAEQAVAELKKFLETGQTTSSSRPRPTRCSSSPTGPRTRTFSSSTSAPPTCRCGRRIAAPISCMWCPTGTCWPTRSPNIS